MRSWVAVTLAIAATSCAAGGVIQTARRGDLASLKRAIGEAQAAGRLDSQTVTELARVVAGREVRSAVGDDAPRRVAQIERCAKAILPVLRDRARTGTEEAAAAAGLLVELGQADTAAMVRRYHSATSGGWRAVAAKATLAPKYAALRRRLLVDADQRVRRGALAAVLRAPQPDDLESLLEAARLDPDPKAREMAVRAVGELGNRHAVLAFKDQWARAGNSDRFAIVAAWAEPGMLREGGREALRKVAEERRGLGAAAAARELSRLEGADGRVGSAVLAHFIETGSEAEQELAILATPINDPDVVRALERTAENATLRAKVFSLGRLTELAAERGPALRRLRKLATRQDPAGPAARAALAAAQDSAVIVLLSRQLASPRPRDREWAALSMLWLGETAAAAPALADDDPRIRTEVACTILAPQDARLHWRSAVARDGAQGSGRWPSSWQP
ncbi:hypothetical protein ACFL5O_07315 [Myxococcota bacterium]